MYKDVSTLYREYIPVGNYDEIAVGGSINGTIYYIYIDQETAVNTITSSIVADGPSGTGNCIKVTYDLGPATELPGYFPQDITSLAVGIDFSEAGAPPGAVNTDYSDIREYK